MKLAVITSQNKIVTPSKPDEETNVQLHTAGELALNTHQHLRRPTNRINAHAEHVASHETDKAISFINKMNLGWTADTCKLQAQHPEYGAHCAKEQLLV